MGLSYSKVPCSVILGKLLPSLCLSVLICNRDLTTGLQECSLGVAQFIILIIIEKGKTEAWDRAG